MTMVLHREKADLDLRCGIVKLIEDWTADDDLSWWSFCCRRKEEEETKESQKNVIGEFG